MDPRLQKILEELKKDQQEGSRLNLPPTLVSSVLGQARLQSGIDPLIAAQDQQSLEDKAVNKELNHSVSPEQAVSDMGQPSLLAGNRFNPNSEPTGELPPGGLSPEQQASPRQTASQAIMNTSFPKQPTKKELKAIEQAKEPQNPEENKLGELYKAAMLASQNNLNSANLFKATNAFHQGRVSNEFANDLQKQAYLPLEMFGNMQQQEKAMEELSDKKALDNPNSDISKLARQTMASIGVKVPDTMNAGMLKAAGVNIGTLLGIREAGKAKKEAMQEANENKEENRKFRKKQNDVLNFGRYQSEFNKDKVVEKARAGLASAMDAKELLRVNNPISTEAAKTAMARLAGEVGVLTDRDVERFGGSKAINSKIKQSVEQMKSGKLTPENRQYLTEILNAFETQRKKQIDGRAMDFAKQGAKRFDVPLEEAWDYLLPGASLPKEEPIARNPQKENAPKGKIKVTNPQGQEGYIPEEQLEDALAQGYKRG